MFILNIINFKYFFLYLSCLILPTLIVGPFIPDLFVVLLSFFFIGLCVHQKKIIFQENYFLKLFLFFFLILMLSSLFSDYKIYSFKYSLSYLRFGFFTLALYWIILNNKNFLDIFKYFLFFSFFLLFFDSIYQLIFDKNILGFKIIQEGRISSFFRDELILGSYVSRIYPLLVLCCICNKSKNYSLYLYNVINICCLLLVIISGERTALLLFVIQYVIFFLFLKVWDVSYKKKILIIFVFILTIFLMFNYHKPFQKIVFKNTIETFWDFKKNKIKLKQSDHIYLIQSSLYIFSENLLFGSGPGTFRLACKENMGKEKNFFSLNLNPDIYKYSKCNNHPHNTYFQLMAELGFLGFLFISIIFLFLIKNFFRVVLFLPNYKFYNEFLVVSVSLMISLFPFAQTGNFFNNWISIIYFFPIALYLIYFPKNFKF